MLGLVLFGVCVVCSGLVCAGFWAGLPGRLLVFPLVVVVVSWLPSVAFRCLALCSVLFCFVFLSVCVVCWGLDLARVRAGLQGRLLVCPFVCVVVSL